MYYSIFYNYIDFELIKYISLIDKKSMFIKQKFIVKKYSFKFIKRIVKRITSNTVNRRNNHTRYNHIN